MASGSNLIEYKVFKISLSKIAFLNSIHFTCCNTELVYILFGAANELHSIYLVTPRLL